MSTFEHILARELGQPRELLKSIRLKSLGPDDWREEPGRGIVLADSGVEKIRAALLLPLEAVAREERADMVVVRLLPNPRVVDACRDGEEGGEVVRVKIVNHQPFELKKNRRLPGCVFDAEAGVWNFYGRAPRA